MTIRQATRPATRRAAFTLMEMLVVVAIIVIVAGMAVPAVTGYLEQARLQTAQAGIANVVKAVEAFKLRKGYPPEQLQHLVVVDLDDGTPALLQEKDLIDPWNTPYQYDPTRFHPNNGRPWVESLGPRKQPGHPDLNSWK